MYFIFYQSFWTKFDADRCLHQSFVVLFLYFAGKKENFGINDAIAEQNATTLQKHKSKHCNCRDEAFTECFNLHCCTVQIRSG